MTGKLKLVVLFDIYINTYAIHSHNLTPEAAERIVAECRLQDQLALIVSQRTEHYGEDAEECWACRRDVEDALNIEPKPRFQRRNIA